MIAAERQRLRGQIDAWMTMQIRRCERLADNRVAEYHERVKAAQPTVVTVTVRGTYGGRGSNYGRAISEPGWTDTCQELVERRGR